MMLFLDEPAADSAGGNVDSIREDDVPKWCP